MESDASRLAAKWDKESNALAIKLYLENSNQWLQRNNYEQAAANLLEAGRQNIISGNRRQAEKLFKNALNLLNTPPNKGLRASLLSELAYLSFEAGKVPESEKYIEEALILAEKSEDSSALGRVYQIKGLFNYFNDEDKAIAFFQKSEEHYRKAEDRSSAIKPVIGLGYVYLVQSEFQKSLETLDRALSECGQINDRRGTALTYKAIGSVYKQMYDYPKATEYFQKAEQLFPEGLDLDEKAMLYNWLGSLYEEYGDWSLSLSYRQKAYDCFFASDHTYGQMTTLISIARLKNLLDANAAALRDIEQAEIFSKNIKNNFYAALIAEEKGSIYLKQHNLPKAVAALEKALRLYDAKLYQRQFARVHNKLGEILERQNRFSEAVRHFNLSLVLSRKVRDTLTESQTLYHLAKLDFTNGKTETALEFIKKSIAETESSGSDLFNAKLKSLYLSNVYERYELYIKILMRNRSDDTEAATKALQTAEMSRARRMLENISLSGTNFSKDADLKTIEKERNLRRLINYKADKLSDLLIEDKDQAQINKLDAEIRELEHELEEVKGIVKQNSPIYSAIKNPAPFDVVAFQKLVLDENSLLLEFSFGNEESYLWLVGKNEFSYYVLPDRRQIETKIAKLRELLAASEPLPNEAIGDYQIRTKKAEENYNREAQVLSDWLFGQIAGQIAGKRLIVVPDGKLNYFPVSALPFPASGDGAPFLLTNEIVYQPSASTLLLAAKSEKPIGDERKNLLVFADPVFTSEDARARADEEKAAAESLPVAALNLFRSAESLDSLPRLFASRDEADSIIEIVGDDQAHLAAGFAATRERFLDAEMANYKIIHFATHNFLDETRPELSSLVLSRFTSDGRIRDGVVRLNDVYGLHLTAELVVLSACSTGIGKEIKGEGLMSLDNAFLQIGAKSVISSLWKAEDNATRDLMSNFYGELSKGTAATTAEAFRRAQIKTRQNPQYRSPFYWAAFTVKGNFRAVPRISRSSSRWIYAAGAVPFFLLTVGGGVHLYRRRKKSLHREIVAKS